MELNLKDKQFKLKISEKLGLPNVNQFNCDFEVAFFGVRLLFEYENSSRGLMSNTLKVMEKAKDCLGSFKLILIRTKHHQEKHALDYNRTKFLIENLKLPNLDISIINEQDLDNTLTKLLSK